MAGLNDLIADGGKLAKPSLGSVVSGGTNKELMADARAALSGMWFKAMLGFVVYSLLIFSFMAFIISLLLFISASTAPDADGFMKKLVMLNPVLQLIQFLISGAVAVGIASFYLGIAQEGEARFENLFTGFRRFFKSLGVYFLSGLFIFLWSLLLVVPGIIAAFRYAMAYYIIADDEDCGPWEALGRSKDMMKGNKWKFFCLNLRFIGWALLASLTGGIGYLWLVPYMQTSFAMFYEDVS